MIALAGCTLAVVAGGRGTRLGGADKSALLLADGRTILARTLETLAPWCDDALVAGGAAPHGVRAVPDAIAGRGAPGGVLSACEAARTPWVLAIGADMPLVDPAVVAALWAERDGHDVVIAEVDGRVQPLHAFYRAETCAAAFRPLLEAGRPGFAPLLAAVRTHVVPGESLRAIDPGLRSFSDADTEADLVALGLRRP